MYKLVTVIFYRIVVIILNVDKINTILQASAISAAPLLLGCEIKRQTSMGIVRLRIVETEAYHQDDPASHSYRGQTPRTAPMFLAGGTIYVYFTYGMHHCINIVTGLAGRGEAVLLRAAEPLEGIEIMKANRGIENSIQLTNGPARLAQALEIRDTSLSGQRLNPDTLEIMPATNGLKTTNIIAATRIGIRKAMDENLRFYIEGNPYVSRTSSIGAEF